MKCPNDKATLRATALAFRKSIPATEQQRRSAIIIEKLLRLLQQSTALNTLLSYRSMPSEVDTAALFELTGYRTFAPVTHHHEHMEWHLTDTHTDWGKGTFGVQEPAAGQLWQGDAGSVLLCPLVAFDRQGNRLGMGKGCFDYWLEHHRQQLQLIIGLAFAGQEVAHIPAEGHDVPMDYVITEKEVIQCAKA